MVKILQGFHLTMKDRFGKFNAWRASFIIIVVMTITSLFSFPILWFVAFGPLHYGAHTELYPFLDMHGRLAAFDATRDGIEIQKQPNPYDPQDRINIKPTWPLHLTFLGLGREHLLIAGFTTVSVFLGILFAILRPEKWYEALLFLVLCLSPPILMGIERANDDLVYLSLLSTIPLILTLKSSNRLWLVWLVVFLLAPAKYYPGAVFVIFLLEVTSWRKLAFLFGAGVVFMGGYGAIHFEEINYLRNAVPAPTVFMVHGSSLAFQTMGLSPVLGKLYSLGLAVIGAFILIRQQWPILHLSVASQRWYLVGYAVMLFCFVLNSNFDYRFVYVLLMVPMLIEITRQSSTNKNWAAMAGILLIIFIPVLWLDVLNVHNNWLIHGVWTRDFVPQITIIKNLIFCFFMIGATVLAATILRPNIRHLITTFSQDVRPKKLAEQ